MSNFRIPKEAKGAMWLGAVALFLKALNDLYKWLVKTLKEVKEEEKKEKELEELKKRRPWDYYTPPQKGVSGSNLTSKERIPLWGNGIYEGYCFILFAPTNVGKTALALQIANELAYNKTSTLMPQWSIGQGRRIMYFDEEYGLDHFPSELKDFYKSQKEDRVELYNQSGGLEEFLDRLYKLVLTGSRPTIAFIDNIGGVCGGNNIAKEKRLIEGVWKIIRYIRDKVQPSISLTVVLIGHTNTPKYIDRFKHCSEGNLQGASEQANYATGMIELAYTHKAGFYRLAFPKNKAVQASDKVYIIHRRDALNFEFVCQMDENEALEKSPTFISEVENEHPLVDLNLLARAERLNSKDGKEELEELKQKLSKEEKFANMDDADKAFILSRAKELCDAGYTPRLTSVIILLEMNIYVSHDTINKKV